MFSRDGEFRWKSRRHQIVLGGGPDGYDVFSLFTRDVMPVFLGHFSSVAEAEGFLAKRGEAP